MLLNELKFTILNFEALVTQTIIIPPGFSGIWFRNAIGKVWKETLTQEDYFSLWESKLDKGLSNLLNIGGHSPRGYIIEPPLSPKRKYTEGEKFSFRIILVGNITLYAPHIIFAIKFFEKEHWFGRSKGYGRGNFRLLKVTSGDNVLYNSLEGMTGFNYDEYNSSSIKVNETYKEIILNFVTPTRIIQENSKQPVIPEHLNEFKIIIESLSRRIKLMKLLHCCDNLAKLFYEEPEKLKQIISEMDSERSKLNAQAAEVKIKSKNLLWIENDLKKKRKNNNSKEHEFTEQKFGGFVGEITFTGNLQPFIPLLILGEHLHIGKDYVYGLGKYEILN